MRPNVPERCDASNNQRILISAQPQTFRTLSGPNGEQIS